MPGNIQGGIKMRIQHNIAAMNSYRQLGGNNSALSKNLEKLSSGYKINRAGDDAAGLAISEKMRSQITGLKKAQDNANDGISLVQTAEGALTEVHSMLNRMVELADQSANGTYDNETDRANLQKEVASLKSEIDRISESTNFNGIQLLDGSMGGAGNTGVTFAKGGALGNVLFNSDEVANKVDVAISGLNKDDTVTVSVGTTESVTKTYNQTQSTALGKDVWDYNITLKNGKTYTQEDLDALTADSGLKFAASEDSFKVSGTAGAGQKDTANVATQAVVNDGKWQFTSTVAGSRNGVSITITDAAAAKGVTVDKTNGNVTLELDFTNKAYTEDEINQMLADAGATVRLTSGDVEKGRAAATLTFNDSSTTDGDVKGTGAMGLSSSLTLQVGDTADNFNKVTVNVDSMDTKSLGIADIDISTQDGAAAAISKINGAINKVSSTRGDLGAIQNRLEHTINNLGVTEENMTSAESRIRDTDMASEMMAYTKNNILIQASQAMLAQANQLPQGVLQLLQ